MKTKLVPALHQLRRKHHIKQQPLGLTIRRSIYKLRRARLFKTYKKPTNSKSLKIGQLQLLQSYYDQQRQSSEQWLHWALKYPHLLANLTLLRTAQEECVNVKLLEKYVSHQPKFFNVGVRTVIELQSKFTQSILSVKHLTTKSVVITNQPKLVAGSLHIKTNNIEWIRVVVNTNHKDFKVFDEHFNKRHILGKLEYMEYIEYTNSTIPFEWLSNDCVVRVVLHSNVSQIAKTLPIGLAISLAFSFYSVYHLKQFMPKWTDESSAILLHLWMLINKSKTLTRNSVIHNLSESRGKTCAKKLKSCYGLYNDRSLSTVGLCAGNEFIAGNYVTDWREVVDLDV